MCKHLQSQGFSTTTYTFPTGCVFGDHSHSCDKRDAILSGKFLFRMRGEEVRPASCWAGLAESSSCLQAMQLLQAVLQAGDMLDVPCNVTHYAEVLEGPCTFVDASKR